MSLYSATFPYRLLMLLILSLSHSVIWAQPFSAPKVVEVETARVEDLSQTVRLIGTIRAKHASLLTAKVKGVLDYVRQPGERVLKGQLIAKLENVEIQNHYELARTSADIAKKQYDRVLKLKAAKVISAVDLENKKIHWLAAKKTLSAAKIEYDKTEFLAPFDGIVGTYKLHEGTQAQPEDPIVYFYDPENLVVEFNIPAPILEKLPKQPEVIIQDKTIKLPYIQKMIDPTTQMSPAFVQYHCVNCVIGSQISVDLIVEQKYQVPVIPYRAVFLRRNKPYVYVIKNAKVILTPVKLGIRSKDKVEIRSGITLTDQLVVKGHKRLYPAQSVKIKKDS